MAVKTSGKVDRLLRTLISVDLAKWEIADAISAYFGVGEVTGPLVELGRKPERLFKLSAEAGTFVARVENEAAAFEQRWRMIQLIRHRLATKGFPTPRPVIPAEASPVLRLSTGHLVVLERFDPGIPASAWIPQQPHSRRALEHVIFQVGSALATLHSIDPDSPSPPHRLPTPARSQGHWRLLAEVTRTTKQLWAGDLQKALPLLTHATMIAHETPESPTARYAHGDLSPDNTLVHEDGTIAIIDWEMFGTDRSWAEPMMATAHWIQQFGDPAAGRMLMSGYSASPYARPHLIREITSGMARDWLDQVHYNMSLALGDFRAAESRYAGRDILSSIEGQDISTLLMTGDSAVRNEIRATAASRVKFLLDAYPVDSLKPAQPKSDKNSLDRAPEL